MRVKLKINRPKQYSNHSRPQTPSFLGHKLRRVALGTRMYSNSRGFMVYQLLAYSFQIFTRIKFLHKNKHHDGDDDDDDDNGLFWLSTNSNEGEIAVHGFIAALSGLCACVKCWLSRCCPSRVNALLP